MKARSMVAGVLLLIFAFGAPLAAEGNTVQQIQEEVQQKPDGKALEADKPPEETADTKSKKAWSFKVGGELTNYFVSESHTFFGDSERHWLETTGAHLEPKYLGEQYLFPRFLEKKAYKFRNNYIEGVPLAFQREEEIEGVNTYLFSYHGYGEYTESYVGTAEYPGLKVESGQEIRCDDDQFLVNAWVEPVTGEILKLEEGCSAGDSFYDKATGQRLGAFNRWSGKTAVDDDIQRAEMISRDRSKLLWVTRYIPSSLMLAGIVLRTRLYSQKFIER